MDSPNQYRKDFGVCKDQAGHFINGYTTGWKKLMLQKLFKDAEYVTLDDAILAEEAEENPGRF